MNAEHRTSSIEPRKTLIIAEAGVNHNGELANALRLVEVAAEAGADYVKFQTFRAEQLVSRAARKADYQVSNTGNADPQLDMLRRLELSEADHEAIIAHCEKTGIKFLSTAFDLDSITLLDRLGIPFFKVPSGELTNTPYLRRIGGLGKDVILSTGMATLADIERAIGTLEAAGTPRHRLTVLHCNTEYPTPMPDVNLRAMRTIREAFGVRVGYSDHTLGTEIPVAAVALGATVIEKHFTLDKTWPGPDHPASLEPAELKAMVAAIRNIEVALGDGIKRPSASEQKNMAIARKSIHLATKLQAGHLLRAEDLVLKRPGDGIQPELFDTLVGRRLANDLPEEHQLRWEDLH
jgi:N,N'-diacetyllegionaminate synthase